MKETRESLQKRWLTALRSGEYDQTTGALRKNDSYCCLGVLCDLVAKDKWRDSSCEQGNGIYSYRLTVKSKNTETALPPSLRKKIGLSVREEDGLAALNDRGTPFKAIAVTLKAIFTKKQKKAK